MRLLALGNLTPRISDPLKLLKTRLVGGGVELNIHLQKIVGATEALDTQE